MSYFLHSKPFLFVFLCTLFSSHLVAQNHTVKINTVWDEGSDRCLPCDYNPMTAEVLASKTVSIPFRGEHKFTHVIEQISYKTIELPSFYDKNLLPSKTEVKIDFGLARIENFISVSYDPIIYVNGVVKIVDEIVINVTGEAVTKGQDRSAYFAPVSVLKTGDWYKIGVKKTGVYKLDESYLSSLGVNTSGLNPNHINIYGNHTPRLPENNNIYRHDDLVKNSIIIQGDADGSFDAADFILFYATGPEELFINPADMTLRSPKIDSLSYYFLRIDASDPPQRVSSIPNSGSAVTHTVTKGNDVVMHELDETNLVKSGDEWLGEQFDIELVKNITLYLDQVSVSDSIKMKTQYASSQKSGSSDLSVAVNGITKDIIPSTDASGEYTEASLMSSTVGFAVSSANMNIQLTFNRSTPATEAWLDYILVNFTRNLSMGSQQFIVRSLPTVGVGNVVDYTISNTNSSLIVWEVTDPTNAQKISGTLSGSNYSFIQNADSLRSFTAFYSSQAYVPDWGEKIGNQNLHGLAQADYIIVTHESLKAEADRLADLHRAKGLTVHVLNTRNVFNEFGGGAQDPVSIRWLMKMFYDRAGGDPNLMPKYLCLFGDGTYDPLDRVPNNNNLVPTYQSNDSGPIEYISSFVSDDFFGILDDLEGMGPGDLMDIGVGRIPVSDLQTASDVINKIEHYMNFGSYYFGTSEGANCDETGYASTFGDWRSRLVFIADDEDGGQFIEDCEQSQDTVSKYFPEINTVKLYLDAYKQIATSGGQRYPDVEEAINQNINKGTLVMNYVGHGGETGLTLERVLTIPQIEQWRNIDKLTTFISATCEFSRYDDPGRTSAGEIMLLTPLGGAVTMMTTTRLVLITVNTQMVLNLYTVLFLEENGAPLAVGEIMRRTKNLSSGSGNNRRAFALLGDPALKLGKPQPFIRTDSINGISVTAVTDTLKALSRVTVKGHVENEVGSLLSGYNGIVYPTVYDKPKGRLTLGQDPGSPIIPFDSQTNVIYKGKSTVSNGYFEFSFVVPKDIDYQIGKGKISYYSDNNVYDNYGYDTAVVVGGVDPNGINDNVGPTITLYLNDPNFANGGLTDENPLFIAEVTDENGVNTTGNGIGHDITLIIDANTANPIILNNFYEANLDTYQSGKVSYPLTDLEEGEHTLTFKVWDVNNNSAEESLEFVVVEDAEIGISHLLNYPNPFTTNTDFFFEHNQVCNSLQVKIEIFTVSGKVVKTLQETVNSFGFRSDAINWDGRDEYGDKLGRGVYVYRLSIETPNGKKAEKIEKLVIL